MTENTSPLVASADFFPPVTDQEAAQTLMDVLGDSKFSRGYPDPKLTRLTLSFLNSASSPVFTSPEFTSPEYPMSEFLTSPWDDSPLGDMLTTPCIESEDADVMTSPLLDYNEGFGNMSLFGDMSAMFDQQLATEKPSVEPTPPAPSFNAETMYKITSPVTPSLDPSSLYPSPRQPANQSSFPSDKSNKRKTSATGTRKNITPDSLVPLEAPTQPRKYTTPSATSRKELPAVFAKKRSRSQAFADEEDELVDEPLPPNATEKEQIEWKRRQNTLAARKSRKRKLEHQQLLETSVSVLTQEKETWKTRALTFQAMLRSHGIDSPDLTEP